MAKPLSISLSLQEAPTNLPLIHPLSLSAMTVLGLNDHFLKFAYPGFLSGKLSDFAGLIFFPLLLELLIPSRRIAVTVTGIGFMLVKGTAWGCGLWNSFFTEIYRVLGSQAHAALLKDPGDLIALVALLIPLLLIPERKNNAAKD